MQILIIVRKVHRGKGAGPSHQGSKRSRGDGLANRWRRFGSARQGRPPMNPCRGKEAGQCVPCDCCFAGAWAAHRHAQGRQARAKGVALGAIGVPP